MKHFYLPLIGMFMGLAIIANSQESMPFCGSMDYAKLSAADFEVTPGELANKVNAGLFELIFDNVPAGAQASACEAFQILSNIVQVAPGGENPVIRIRWSNLPGNQLGTANPNWSSFSCGFTNNQIFDHMNFGYPPGYYSSNFSTGMIQLDNSADWHFITDDPIDPDGDAFDLVTVILHEALHIMGFSSKIGFTGAPNGPGVSYSNWDQYLFDEDIDEPLIVLGDPIPGCCTNPAANPNITFPDDFENGCANNVFFNDGTQNIAQVHTFVNNPDLPNLLSHIEPCAGGDPFLMSGSIEAGQTRRQLSNEEIQILVTLGYHVNDQKPPCLINANTDLFDISQNTTILFADILANDNIQGGIDDITIHTTGCVTGPPGWTIDIQADQFVIENAPIGIISICYTIEGCDGECSDATIRMFNVQALPPCEPCEGGTHFCYGDLEAFIPIMAFGFAPQLGLPICYTDNQIETTSDLYIEPNGNQVFGVGSGGITVNDYFPVPLSPAIIPGCKFEICFDATVFGCDSEGIDVSFWGTTSPPCSDVWGQPCIPGSGGPLHCIETVDIDQCSDADLDINVDCDTHISWPDDLPCGTGLNVSVITGIEMQTYCFQATNDSGEAWDYIYIGRQQNSANFGSAVLDNISITSDCCADDPCSTYWELNCYDGYFCIQDEFGNSPYMTWINPPFPSDPHGHCQALDGMIPGQPISFIIHIYDDGIFQCDYEVNTTFDCGDPGPGGCHLNPEINCLDGYFCVVDQSGNSPFLEWIDPPFSSLPNGHCQPYDGLIPGQPLSFMAFIQDGEELCTLYFDLTLDCQFFDDGSGGKSNSGFGFNKKEFSQWNLYPNPANEFLTIENRNEFDSKIDLFRIDGQFVQTLTLSSNTSLQIDVKHLNSGVYFARFSTDSMEETELMKFTIIK